MTTSSIPVVRSIHPGDLLASRTRTATIVVLGALVALGPFTIDLYLPAFPAVQADLGVPAVAIQLTLTGTIIGFALGQLLVGPLSDRFGRRAPLLICAVVHIAACVLASFAPDILSLGILRVLQGAGAAGGGVVAQAIVRDLFGGQRLVRVLARMGLITGLAPLLAPLAGSQLLRILDWRGLFLVLACYGAAAVVLATMTIGESRPRSAREIVGHDSVGARYRAVLGDRVFIGVAVVGGMQFAGLFAYLSSSSFVFQELYGLSAQQYGLLFAMNSLGVVLGSQAAARIMRRVGPQWILACTTAVQCSAAVAIVLVGHLGLVAVLIPLWFFIAACGFGFPTVQVLGLVRHGAEAGTAASLLGAVNFGLAGAISPIVGALGLASVAPMGGVMAVTAAVGAAALWLVVRPKTVPSIGD